MFKIGDVVYVKGREEELKTFVIVGVDGSKNTWLVEHPTWGIAGTSGTRDIAARHYGYKNAKENMRYSSYVTDQLVSAVLTKSTISSRLVHMYSN